MGIVEQYLLQLNKKQQRFRRNVALLTVMSLLVMLAVSWNLRQTGITLANDAACGIEEHRHTDECNLEKVLICGHDVEMPTEKPTEEPTEAPTELPTEKPTEAPTEVPTELPTEKPTEEPTEEPTEKPTEKPTEAPTEAPTEKPTEAPTELPTEKPTEAPTEVPTELPTEKPTKEPTEAPTEKPTEVPTEVPTEAVHVHSDECYEITYQCGFEEHIHDFSCYPDLTADLEDWDIWAASIPELTGRIAEDIVLVAQSQLGNLESTLNYELSDDGQTRNGISRYGQWYGNPYGAWSNMFTSFCLRYAGLTNAPINSGAEAMRLNWEEANLYRYAGGYEPLSGDIVFLDKNQNGTPESTAVVVRYFDFILTVIEGDVDNSVVQQEYRIDDPVIVGYGVTNPRGGLMFAAVPDTAKTIGHSVAYSNNLFQNRDTFILYTVDNNGTFYAIDGNGKAVEVTVDGSGVIYADVDDPGILYWKFSNPGNTDGNLMYAIVNVSTGKALHPYNDSATDNGVLHTTAWQTVMHANDTGVKLRGNNQNWYAMLNGDEFGITNSQNRGSVFYFGEAPKSVTLWLDGTNGNIMSYRGSDNTKYTLFSGTEAELPSEWKSPTKYSYKLAGWVNIQTGDYYLPGDTIAIEEDTVLYADWVASTYDIGQYNSLVADTISTNDFITTHVFDYSSLINLNSTKVNVTVSDTSHSETWSHVQSGTVSYKDQTTLNFSFNDHDSSGTITNPNGRGEQGRSPNAYTGGTAVYPGIYNNNAELGNAMFGLNNLFNPETGEGIVGKHYLGTGDHLFQINTDPTSEYYGYYYYDAKLNAASYNQTDQRFYVYEYLARTTDSTGNNDAGKYSDFLPLNSPYANTNGQAIKTYNYNGDNGEYVNVAHYEYDARYDTDNSNNKQIKANLWFGMRTDVQFALPNQPGTGGNKDIYGKDMHFKFTGDDDVWILIDGKVVLDLGGIHQAADGDINFSTGEVRVNGKTVTSVINQIEPGEHTLSILYLERGSSMSNCAIYFNLAPRFSLTLQKEDVLTQEVLNGAIFAFYHDQACTQPCDLWSSQRSYRNGDAPTNVFTIAGGSAYIWGLNPSSTYYIKEVAPPNASGYDPAKGVIRLTLDKNGLNSYSATILESVDKDGNKEQITHGFTIHGFRIDEESQAAYIVITNAQNWVTETTSVYVEKKWNDSENHTYDSVTVYLNITDPNGTVRRIREIALSRENNWKYTWSNLPKYTLDPETMTESDIPVKYSVSEAYVPGYTNRIDVMVNGTYTEESWSESIKFTNGAVYILKTNNGCLSAVSADGETLCLVDEATAKESGLALWKATVSSGKVRLTNQYDQVLNCYISGRTRYFNLVSAPGGSNLTPTEHNGGFRLISGSYYLCAINSNTGRADAKTQASSALTFKLIQKTETTTTVDLDGFGYSITNTPLTTETSLKVTKRWEHLAGDESLYEKAAVTVKLLANGVETGRTETISLKTDWCAVFNGLPYLDENGEPIVYSVVENWDTSDWIPVYGPVTATDGEIPTYEVIVTNVYRWIDAWELPATGGIGYPFFVLSGLILALGPLVYGLHLRRRYRKGARK